MFILPVYCKFSLFSSLKDLFIFLFDRLKVTSKVEKFKLFILNITQTWYYNCADFLYSLYLHYFVCVLSVLMCSLLLAVISAVQSHLLFSLSSPCVSRTLALIKPDVVTKIGDILELIYSSNLIVTKAKMTKLTW